MSLFNSLKQKYRYSIILLRQLVITDFKIRYKGSALGYVWTLLRPLALFTVLYVVFVNFLKIGSDIPYYAVYLLSGVVLWNYFVEVTNNGVMSIVGRGDLLRKLSFPRYVVVISGSVSALINLLINLVVIAIFMLISGVPFTVEILWIIPLIIELFVFSFAVALILSALYVRFRDINFIWELVLQAGFYATPVLYPLSMVASKTIIAAKLLILNPIAQIIQDFRYVVVTHETMTINSLYSSWFVKFIPLCIVVFMLIIGILYFKKKSPYFAEDI